MKRSLKALVIFSVVWLRSVGLLWVGQLTVFVSVRRGKHERGNVGGLRAGVCRLKEKNWHTMYSKYEEKNLRTE